MEQAYSRAALFSTTITGRARVTLAGNGLVALAALLALVLGAAGPAAAVFDTRLVVTVSDDPDPVASGGQVNYTVLVKADGPTKAKNVVVTMPMPAGTVFVKCNMVLGLGGTTSTPCTPGLANGTVTVALGNIKAHLQARITLTLTMPTVTVVTPVTLDADANSTTVSDDHNHATTSVLPAAGSFVTYLPSGRVGPISCGDTLTPAVFGSDTTAKLNGDLGCTSGAFGLKITAAGKTLNLNKVKIFWSASSLTLGSVGILVSNAANVTIVGGGTNGTSGIEKFDWCVKDEGPSNQLTISTLRCFRARTAGFDISSQNSTVLNSLVDRATGTATTTFEPPGGVGIRTRGDNMHIAATIVRRSATVGIWVAGLDSDSSGRVALIDGNTSTMRIENNSGIGLRLDGGPHSVKDVYIQGVLPGTGKDGVVVGPTGVDSILDGVVVKEFGGNGFVVNGTGIVISRSNVENIGLDGYVIAGSGSLLSGDGVQQARHGYVVTGLATVLESNGAEELDGDGFVLNADNADAAGNTAKNNAGRGFVIAGGAGLFETNTAEANAADGFVITGNNNTVKGSTSKKSGATGITISGTGNSFNTNGAEQNTGNEWVIGPNNTDDGGNTNNGSTFSFGAAGGTFN